MLTFTRNSVKSYGQFQNQLFRLIDESRFVIISKRHTSHDYQTNSSSNRRGTYVKALALASLAGLAGYYYQQGRRGSRASYSATEVARRGFTSYDGGVYDLKAYGQAHPGGEEAITELAGKQLEPCWEAFRFHKREQVLELLETMRIGDLKTSGSRPDRCKTAKNVPKVKPEEYRLEIALGKMNVVKSISLDDLKRYSRHSIVSAIPCKSTGKKESTTTRGPTWTGARLSDVLRDLDLKKTNYDRLQFECLDSSKPGSPSGPALSLEQALNPDFDVLLAYEMDGAELSPEHGYPVRVVVTQLAGKRNVKWLSRIVLLGKDDQDDALDSKSRTV